MLGIFYRLFTLLDDACHQLDLSASLQGSECGPSYQRYSAPLGKLTNFKDELSRLENELTVLEQIVTFLAATLPIMLPVPTISQFGHTGRIYEGEKEEEEAVLDEGFHKEEGPFIKALDRALASFNVQRQAYFAGTFVGNHVHRTLKIRLYW